MQAEGSPRRALFACIRYAIQRTTTHDTAGGADPPLPVALSLLLQPARSRALQGRARYGGVEAGDHRGAAVGCVAARPLGRGAAGTPGSRGDRGARTPRGALQ